MSSFHAVNTVLTVPDAMARKEDHTPTTPRPSTSMFDAPADPRADDAARTPTRDTFNAVADRPPTTDDASSSTLKRTAFDGADPGFATRPEGASSASHDVKMDGTAGDDDGSKDASDDDDDKSVASDITRPNKKKKGQRFFCTDFPPCQLSFTRSEHLARHIRKHTGERPFQCHCNRRFSRLDNLRQHAQTVHVNEDIPGDSLAATGTRYQRQIRTDRVRPGPGGRSRASTLGSGTHSRGHSRNLSASSIASTASTMSIGIGGRDDRLRPAPLAMADHGMGRGRLSLDTFHPATLSRYPPHAHPPPYGPGYGGQSPNGYSTPTSATFPPGAASPHYSGIQSPGSHAPRSIGGYGARTQGRRLSVPSVGDPSPGPQPYPSAYISPVPSSGASGQSSILASPTSSTFAAAGRRESDAEADLRRRTWHPHTYTGLGPRPATSGVAMQGGAPEPRPLFGGGPHAAPPLPGPPFPTAAAPSHGTSTVTRLPGIESFDHAPPQPNFTFPPRRQATPPASYRPPSPMQIDSPSGATVPNTPSTPHDRSNHRISWDLSHQLQKGIGRLDITSATPPMEPERFFPPTLTHHRTRSEGVPRVSFAPSPRPVFPPAPVAEQPASPVTPTSKRSKRMGWYRGPMDMQAYAPHPGDAPATRPFSGEAPLHESPVSTTTPSNPPLESMRAAASVAPQSLPYAQPGTHQHHRTSPGTESSSSDNGSIPTPSTGMGDWHSARPATEETLSHGLGIKPEGSSPARPDLRGLEALVAVATGEGSTIRG